MGIAALDLSNLLKADGLEVAMAFDPLLRSRDDGEEDAKKL